MHTHAPKTAFSNQKINSKPMFKLTKTQETCVKWEHIHIEKKYIHIQNVSFELICYVENILTLRNMSNVRLAYLHTLTAKIII